MDLFIKVGIAALAIIVIAGIAFGILLFIHHSARAVVTASEAENITHSDLARLYPMAKIYMLNVSKSNTTADSWNIVVNIVYNATSVCPQMDLEYFDYPATEFIPYNEVPEIGPDCEVVSNTELSNSKYVAIAKAYGTGNATIIDYINANGFNSTEAYAKFYPNSSSIGNYAIPNNTWVINYSSTNSHAILYAEMNSSARITSVFSLNKTA